MEKFFKPAPQQLTCRSAKRQLGIEIQSHSAQTNL